ncbi:hypothetical protein ACFV5M_12090 [Streptomyces albidoflavus]
MGSALFCWLVKLLLPLPLLVSKGFDALREAGEQLFMLMRTEVAVLAGS